MDGMEGMDEMLNGNLISGGMNFTGLGSGTDFNQMIEQLVKLEQRKTARLELWKSEWEEKVESFQELNTAMVSLRSNLSNMDSVDKFFVKEATSTDKSVLTASASSETSEGSYNIEVGALAKNQIMFSDEGFADGDTPVNAVGENIFSYTYNGKTVDLEVPDETSLSNFVNLFNNDPNNPGVKARMINQGDEHFLQLRGMDQGADNTITINPETTITAFYDADEGEKFTVSQQAQNSRIRVDGWPADGTWIERETNAISDVIEGLTLNIYDTGFTQVGVENNDQAIKEQVHSFVDQVNEVLTIIKEQTEVSDAGEGSVLTGNYGLQMIQSRMKSITSSIGTGFDRQAGGDPHPSLSTIGISTDANRGSPNFGLLTIDEEELDKALQENPRAVAELISGDMEPDTSSSDFRFGSLLKGITQPGIYDVQYEVAADGTIVPESAYIDGEPAGVDGNFITATTGDARGLSIQVDNLNPGTYSGNVRLKTGKVNELSDALKQLTDSSDGTLNILKDNYQDIMDNIDRKIESEQRRIVKYENNLRERFANLESLLGYYDNLQTSMSAQINQLSSE